MTIYMCRPDRLGRRVAVLVALGVGSLNHGGSIATAPRYVASCTGPFQDEAIH